MDGCVTGCCITKVTTDVHCRKGVSGLWEGRGEETLKVGIAKGRRQGHSKYKKRYEEL